MFLAVCKNSLITCAKGHVLSFPNSCFTSTAVSRCSNVWKDAATSWGHKTSVKTLRTEKKWLQRLKTSFCSLGQWPSLMHFPADKLRARRSTINTGLTGFGKGRSTPVVSTLVQPAQPEGVCQTQEKETHCNNIHASALRRLRGRNLSHAPLSLDFRHVLCISEAPVNPVVLQQERRSYSNLSPGKPSSDEQEVDSKQDSKRENVTPTQGDIPPAANEGSFHFKELYENPWTIPNFLCMARIALAPVLGYLIVEQYFHISLGLFALAGATDLLDGYIARNWANQKSVLGSALDPLADKILISVLYISLTYAHLIPAPLTALVISRDVALIAAVFYVRYKTVPPPITLSKFFNPCYATAQLKPTLISKVNTAIQLVLVAASLASPVFHYTDSVFLQALWVITALTTTASGYSYYHYGKKTVEVLNNTK
ncbi:cardiolipin synthase (CMP-forming) [Anguilla rostrata]|uniref:cardiolipin synthase (CMP-forming) n=1 Tax=Anguilla rostrata TaxID=7938 RepID=UPI0030D070D2